MAIYIYIYIYSYIWPYIYVYIYRHLDTWSQRVKIYISHIYILYTIYMLFFCFFVFKLLRIALTSAAGAKFLAIFVRNHEKSIKTFGNPLDIGRRRLFPSQFRPKSTKNTKTRDFDVKNGQKQ